MKQKLLNKLWLRVGMIVAIMTTALTGTAWAETATWAGTTALPGTATSIGSSPITIKTSSTNTYTNPIRVYANTTITIAATTGYVIQSVTYEASSTGNYVTYAQNATVSPNVTPTVSDKNVTWTLSNVSEFTFKPSSQTRANSITVTYAAAGGTPTCATPTFSVEAGEVEVGTSVEISCATDDATIYYTTDGSKPSTSSSVYNGAITINETMTIKAIAVKDGLENSAVATASYTAIEVVHGYSIDFEQSTTKYVDWEFTNITKVSTIKANSGSYYGNTTGKESASIKTKGKVATPGTLTFYISKETTNSNASSVWKIETSSDGSSWTQVGNDVAAAAGITAEVWTKVSADLKEYTDVYVRISYSGTTAKRAIDDIELEVSSVAKPTFSVSEGTYFEAQNVKVSNYDSDYIYFYTTDGTAPACDSNLDPEGTSQVYDHATGIDITATTTLKMIAADIDASSNVASATYTFPTVYTSIADFKTANTTGYLNLTGAQVVYIDGDKKNIYVRDASGAIDLYNGGGFSTTLQSGDLLSGIIKGTYTLYKQMPEITSIEDISVLTVTGNETVVAKVIDGTTTAIEDNLCNLVKIENTEITGSDPYYVGDNSDIQLYDKWNVGYTVTTDKAVDVSGVAINFDGTYEIYPRFESDIVYLDNAVEVSISAYGYATFCSDKALDFTATDAIKVYYGTIAGDKLTFSRIYKVPANTGVLLVSALGGAVAATKVPVLDGAADDVTGNCLTGVTETTTLNANDYILNVVNGGAGFYKAGDFTSLAANRAYISAALVVGGIKSFGINLTTGIDLPATEKAEKVIFDLSGRRVEKPAKGLYIVNGKKVLF